MSWATVTTANRTRGVERARAATHGAPSCTLRGHTIEVEVQLEHVDARLPEEAQRRALGVRAYEGAHTILAQASHLGHARHLALGGGHRDVRIEPARALGHEVDRDRAGDAGRAQRSDALA